MSLRTADRNVHVSRACSPRVIRRCENGQADGLWPSAAAGLSHHCDVAQICRQMQAAPATTRAASASEAPMNATRAANDFLCSQMTSKSPLRWNTSEVLPVHLWLSSVTERLALTIPQPFLPTQMSSKEHSGNLPKTQESSIVYGSRAAPQEVVARCRRTYWRDLHSLSGRLTLAQAVQFKLPVPSYADPAPQKRKPSLSGTPQRSTHAPLPSRVNPPSRWLPCTHRGDQQPSGQTADSDSAALLGRTAG
mmetsp:Transcript_87853/g.226468  ORF Transcript_87853/g.226468 Transcript_87853/m.226468 type:complete len:250 (-) Transcript_87853:86-835(-)